MTTVTGGTKANDRTRQQYSRRMTAVVLAALLTYYVDSGVVVITAGPGTTVRRLAVALLSAAGIAVLGWASVSRTKSAQSARASYLGLASASGLPRHRVLVRGLMRQEGTARYGDTVWPHSLRRSRAARVVIKAIQAFLLFSLVYANLYSGQLPFVIAVIAAISVAMPAAMIARREAELTVKSIAQATGAHNLTASTTPWRPDEYVAWCQAHDVEPYPLGRPTATTAVR